MYLYIYIYINFITNKDVECYFVIFKKHISHFRVYFTADDLSQLIDSLYYFSVARKASLITHGVLLDYMECKD